MDNKPQESTDAKTDENEDEDLFEVMDISVDTTARNNGTWIKQNKVAPGLVFKAIGFDSPKLRALDIALTNERPDNYGHDDEATIKRNRDENRKKCEAGIIDWRPFNKRGERIEYSSQLKKKFFKDERFEKFLLAAMDAMNQADNVTIKWEKEAEKNSEDGSEANLEQAAA